MQYEELSFIFPEGIQKILVSMKLPLQELQEIRFRTRRPILAVCGGREYWSEQKIQTGQIKEILSYLSGYSVYAYEDEIRQGFLTLAGGHRVGIAGKTVLDGFHIKTITEISSLNIRFAHEVKGCADGLMPWLWEGDRLLHTLLISPPGHGKTTLLRDCIRLVSNGSREHPGLTVGVVDERSEISGSCRGVPGNDLGIRTDVLDCCPKAEGMMMLIRSMAPQVVAVDEIGSRSDMEALQFAVHCGCILLATVHGENMSGLMKKPLMKEMVETGMFERYI
ncbi:MAG: stage III sporulation protein AA, partial [Lachnospiraceae bacterium]|nr:stage III sporulation protein AA [Lachnospiraceae bacterium]